MKQMILTSMVGGLMSIMGYPIFDFKTGEFSVKNTIITFLAMIIVSILGGDKK